MYFKVVILLIQLTLLTINGSPCQKDDDCPSYMGCSNNECALCDKLSSRCGDSYSWPCCGNNTCQMVSRLNASMCFPESCTKHSDCGGGFGCKKRTGKCDLCYKDNDLCIGKPGKRLECCSGECNPVTGICQGSSIYTTTINVTDQNGTVVISHNYLVSGMIDNSNSSCTVTSDCSKGFGCLSRLGKCGLCHPNGERCTLPYDSLECCSSYCRIGVNADGSGVCADPRNFQPEKSDKPVKWSTRPVETTTNSGPPMWNEHLVSLMEPFMTERRCVSYFNCGPKQDCLLKHNKCVTCQRQDSDCTQDSDCCSRNCRQSIPHIDGYNRGKICGLVAWN